MNNMDKIKINDRERFLNACVVNCKTSIETYMWENNITDKECEIYHIRNEIYRIYEEKYQYKTLEKIEETILYVKKLHEEMKRLGVDFV